MPTQTLPSFILSQQRQVCCGGTVEVQTDLMATGGRQGPHGSSPASRHPSLRAGRVSSLPGLFLPPGAPHWGILFCSDGYFIASSLPTPTPQLPLFSRAMCLFGRKEKPPTKAKDSGVLPSETLLGGKGTVLSLSVPGRECVARRLEFKCHRF